MGLRGGVAARFPESTLPRWRKLAEQALESHRTLAAQALAHRGATTLDDIPEPEEVALGLHSPQRLAHIFHRTYERVLAPRLDRLRLL